MAGEPEVSDVDGARAVDRVPAPRRSTRDEPVAGGEPAAGDARGPAGLVAVAIGALAVVWFATSWLVLGSPVVDAAGEAAGGVLALLVLVSTVGALRRSRNR